MLPVYCKGRGDGRQKISKTLLSLSYRRRTDHLAIEVEEVEQEEDERRLIPLSQVDQYLGLAGRIRNGARFDFFGRS